VSADVGTLRFLLRAAVGLAISGVSIYLVTQAISVDKTFQELGTARWEGIGLAVGLLAMDVAFRGLRWRALLAPLAALPRLTVTGHLLVGYLANNALPARLGEVVRAFSLGDREGLSRSAIMGSVVVERLLDVGMLAIAVFVGLAFVSSASILVLAAVSGLAIGLTGLAMLLAISGSGPHARWLDRVPAGSIRSALHGLINGVSVIRLPTVLGRALLLTSFAWAVTALAFAVAGSAVGLELTMAEALLFAAAVNLATAIPAGPGYIGTFELAAVSVAAAIGVPPAAGLAMAVIVHLATLLLTTVGGIGALALLYVAPDSASVHETKTPEQTMAIVREGVRSAVAAPPPEN
jgi:uncharacterized protein (TIRG00374 family)